MHRTIPPGSFVYLRYNDHMLFRNMMTTKITDLPIERETTGWFVKEEEQTIRIHWGRIIRPFDDLTDTPNSGLVLMKNCVLEIHILPLQDFLRWTLSCAKTKDTTVESALQNAKRKTQPK